MKDPIVSFKDFGFQYNAQARPTLRDINLTVYEGEKVLVVGPSGSGKSTLGNCVNGLIPFSYAGESIGCLSVGGKETSGQSLFELSKIVGTVLQDPDGQFVGLTVGEDIAFALENDCIPQYELISSTLEAAKLVGIDGHLSHAPHELSGGQKQRVSLAGVIVDNVKLLLFDEPLANLDPATGNGAIDLIDRIKTETGTTVIIVEHRLEDVLYRKVDRIILVSDGRIVSDSTPATLLSGDLLREHGIREPLYLTALRYAGVQITEEKAPENIETMKLDEVDTAKVASWFLNAPPPSPPVHTAPLLEVKSLSFSYAGGRKALKDVSFCINEGEIIAIAGTNGAGKSTLAKLICGFEKPDTGEILLHGRDMSKDTITERAKKIGYVMQNPNQMISKTMIFDEIALGLKNSGMSGDDIKHRVEDTLKTCGLYPFRNWPISALSFGQKKRVTIASILAIQPEIIMLDEPTAGQDFRHYTEIMEFLRDLNRSGVTIVMITHDMHLMLEYARRSLVFSAGCMLADSTPAKILTNAELVQKASLKETSLYTLAQRCGINDAAGFAQHFIDYDRQVRGNE